eukprot:TRINITY_DN733_c0_g1_i13.p1 TRINITY_DN733_c0_g1~~TRINITY_DN733_c0_g1_i13.p1  ORF type:complete len:309 (-),score=79.67 TRINITY_DN733_c0_g1_i13:123-1049(-)
MCIRDRYQRRVHGERMSSVTAPKGNSKSYLYLGLGAAVFVGAGYLLYRLKKKNTSDGTYGQGQNGIRRIGNESGQGRSPDGLKTKTTRDHNQELTQESILSMNNIVLREAQKEVIDWSRRFRAERRRVIDDLTSYQTRYQDGMAEFSKIIVNIQDQVCTENGITHEELLNSTDYFMNKEDQQLITIQNKLSEMMRGYGLPTKKLGLSKLKEIIEYQVQVTQAEMKEIFTNPIVKTMLHVAPEMSMGMMHMRAADRVFAKFGVEEEDVYESINSQNLGTNPEIVGLCTKLGTLIVEGPTQYLNKPAGQS